MTEKQQQLLFDKGITNVPSDALCSDNALSESVGMVYDNGEHRVVQKPVAYITGLGSLILLYVHKLNNVERYIVKDGNIIRWGTKNAQGAYVPAKDQEQRDIYLMTSSGNVQITSIGQTLIITDDNGMSHFIFNGSGYDFLRFPIPDIGFEAKLVSALIPWNAANTGKAEEIVETTDGFTFRVVGGQQEAYNDLVVGLYRKNLKDIATNKGFAEPFLIRAALEMYDGSYTYITNPILLYPSVTENTKFYVYGNSSVPWGTIPKKFVAITQMLRLYIRQTTDYSAYTDLIKDVVLFASKPISLYRTTQDQPITNCPNDLSFADNVSSREVSSTAGVDASIYRSNTFTPGQIDGLGLSTTTLRCLVKREQKSINEDIAATSLFYKIASLGTKSISSFVDFGAYTTQEVTENLTSQEFLKYDDYYSRSKLKPKMTYVYNSRLNIANVSREFFNGFGYFMPFDHTDTKQYVYTFDVTIKTDTGNVTVRKVVNEVDNLRQKHGIYFFYPDSRATHVKIYKNEWGDQQNAKKILDKDLKEHPALNGAYYFAGFSPTTDEPTGIAEQIPPYVSHDPEILYNYIVQSEVNNPWVFLASGYHTVGTGEVIGMSTITQALSEGQFGAYPLIVFSENGIWAMSVDGTGLYSAMHPMSREICNSSKSITQTDGAIFFSSNKGLMLIVGNSVKCVSEQLGGKVSEQNQNSFVSFLKDAVIAYDYRDSLLWIFTNSGTNAWIYSIKSGTFGRYGLSDQTPSAITVVNKYPDYLIQNEGTVYSLTDRLNINNDQTTYSGILETRPMKLENGLALKSIMGIKHIHDINSNATLTLQITASNNLKNWVSLSSLRGIPWKYYRFRYNFSNLKATDRFSGTVLITQERRIDKLR